MRNQEGKIELQKKIYWRICVSDTTFLIARSPFYVFLLLSSSTPSPFPSDVLNSMPLSENVKLQFIQKDIFLFKTSYILVCSKTFLRLRIKQKV